MTIGPPSLDPAIAVRFVRFSSFRFFPLECLLAPITPARLCFFDFRPTFLPERRFPPFNILRDWSPTAYGYPRLPLFSARDQMRLRRARAFLITVPALGDLAQVPARLPSALTGRLFFSSGTISPLYPQIRSRFIEFSAERFLPHVLQCQLIPPRSLSGLFSTATFRFLGLALYSSLDDLGDRASRSTFPVFLLFFNPPRQSFSRRLTESLRLLSLELFPGRNAENIMPRSAVQFLLLFCFAFFPPCPNFFVVSTLRIGRSESSSFSCRLRV